MHHELLTSHCQIRAEGDDYIPGRQRLQEARFPLRFVPFLRSIFWPFSDSDPESEYEETLHKASALIESLKQC